MPPLHRSIYISAESNSSISISGPPSVLKSFIRSSETISSFQRHNIPLFAAYHATHLGQVDIDQIVGHSSLLDLQLAQNAQLFSTSSGMQYNAKSLLELLHMIVDDILRLPLHIKTTIDSSLSTLSTDQIILHVLGPASSDFLVRQELRNAMIAVTDHSEAARKPFSQTDTPSEAIAIVGMSGRFPGSQNLKEFWQVLEQGKDLHKEAGFKIHPKQTLV